MSLERCFRPPDGRCYVAVSVERGAPRGGDGTYFTGGRDFENASTKCDEDIVGHAWRFWTTFTDIWVMGEGEGRDWAAAVNTVVCLTEENALIQGNGVRTRSTSGGRIECRVSL